ncbi:hypothetical protein [Corallococcus sp. AB049A]|nr:hypothetical protein [Corallococcus sp. AB049A]
MPVPRVEATPAAEASEGVRFLIRSRLFTDDEYRALEQEGPPLKGPRR